MAAVEEANAQIHSRGQASIDFKGMGTTTTVLVLLPSGALLAHVGDSRAYRLRGNRLEQLTFDHSLVWEMRASGQIHGKVPDYVPKNVITRSLGPNARVQVDLEGPLPIATGDIFLMCSDGLSGPVKDEELGMVLGSMPPGDAVRSLVDLANLRGGPDNITVIVAKAVGEAWKTARGDAARPGDDDPPGNPWAWIAKGVRALAGRKKAPSPTGPRFGGGPYAAAVCSPSAEFVRYLSDTLRELREAAAQAEMTLDAERLNEILGRAAAGNQTGDYAQAVRNYCRGVSFLLGEFKRQGKSRPPKRA